MSLQTAPPVPTEGTPPVNPPLRASWRQHGMGLLRLSFGIIWAIDAWFKWQPTFINGMAGYLHGSLNGQPSAVQTWILFWFHLVNLDPKVFAYLEAAAETALAVGLLLGILSNLTYLGGILLSLLIWSTAEGFGGPYGPGSVYIGTAIIYALVFAGLFLASAGLYLGLDRWLAPALGRWSFLASGPAQPKGRSQ